MLQFNYFCFDLSQTSYWRRLKMSRSEIAPSALRSGFNVDHRRIDPNPLAIMRSRQVFKATKKVLRLYNLTRSGAQHTIIARKTGNIDSFLVLEWI